MGEEKMAGADGGVLWRASLERGVVGPSWTILRASSAIFVICMGCLRRHLGHLGRLGEPQWVVVGPSSRAYRHLRLFGGSSGGIWGCIGTISCRPPGPCTADGSPET